MSEVQRLKQASVTMCLPANTFAFKIKITNSILEPCIYKGTAQFILSYSHKNSNLPSDLRTLNTIEWTLFTRVTFTMASVMEIEFFAFSIKHLFHKTINKSLSDSKDIRLNPLQMRTSQQFYSN